MWQGKNWIFSVRHYLPTACIWLRRVDARVLIRSMFVGLHLSPVSVNEDNLWILYICNQPIMATIYVCTPPLEESEIHPRYGKERAKNRPRIMTVSIAAEYLRVIFYKASQVVFPYPFKLLLRFLHIPPYKTPRPYKNSPLSCFKPLDLRSFGLCRSFNNTLYFKAHSRQV